MPGRGAVWRIGGLKDKHVLEEDLSQALQTKVNNISGGTGNMEVLLDTTFGSDATSHDFNFSRSVTMDGSDVGELIVIFSELTLSGSASINVQFNNESFGANNAKGITSDGTTVSAFSEFFISDGFSFDNIGGGIIIEIPGDILDGNTGIFGRWFDRDHYSAGTIDLQTNSFASISSVQIQTLPPSIETLNSVSRVVVYAVNKD